jgi:putative transposase
VLIILLNVGKIQFTGKRKDFSRSFDFSEQAYYFHAVILSDSFSIIKSHVSVRVHKMKYDPAKHHRRSIRLKGYDYSQPGWYFVTICTQHRALLFGQVLQGSMVLSVAGKMVNRIWSEIPEYYPGIEIDEFQIMPDHFHGIIHITGPSQGISPTEQISTPQVVQRFKSLTTRLYIDGVRTQQWPTFDKRVWQRNYYEHIVRSEKSLERIRKYIRENPMKWQERQNMRNP